MLEKLDKADVKATFEKLKVGLKHFSSSTTKVQKILEKNEPFYYINGVIEELIREGELKDHEYSKVLIDVLRDLVEAKITLQQAKNICREIKCNLGMLMTIPVNAQIKLWPAAVLYSYEETQGPYAFMADIALFKEWIDKVVEMFNMYEVIGIRKERCGQVLRDMPELKVITPIEKNARTISRMIMSGEISATAGIKELHLIRDSIDLILSQTF